jgi:chromosome segregation ATPase
MKASYEQHLELVTRQHQEALDKLQRDAEEEKHTLTTQHYQEMDVLRSLLTSEKQKDSQVYRQLQEQVGVLRNELEDVQSEHVLTQTSLLELQAQNESLLNQLKTIQSEHHDLGALLAQQQLDLEAAHKSRQQLLQELLQQEEKVRERRVQGGIEVMQITERIRHQMDQALTGSRPDEEGGTEEEPALQAGPSDENTGGQDYLEELRDDDISAITDSSNF